MRERMKKKKNMIIGGLLAVVFLMSVGYAAFASNLSITGTANTSSWIIKITNIREKTKTSGVTNKAASYTDLTANFNCELTLPGDSITYEVTVENQGNIDASLKEVTKSFTNNKYIDVTYSGLYEGQMLYKQGAENSTAIMEVTVTFKDLDYEGTFTETITSSISLNLNFEQEGNNVDTTKKYLVEYNTGEGTSVESRYVGWNDYIPVYAEIPTQVGYKFGSWKDENGYNVSASDRISGKLQDQNQEGLTLYATWTAKSYTIHYDTQGSSTVIDDNGADWTSSRIYASTNPSLAHYTFGGWYSKPNGKGLEILPSTTVADVVQNQYGKYVDVAGGKKGDEVTLYASWIPNDFTINYHQGAVSPTEVYMPLKSQIVKWNDTNIIHPKPTREGYKFTGWNTRPNGSGDYITDGMLISSYVTSATATKITIYACWEQNE